MRHVPLFFGERIVVRVCGTVCQCVSGLRRWMGFGIVITLFSEV